MTLSAPLEIPLAYSTRVEDSRPGRGQDRVATVRMIDSSVFVVADGAGGVGGGTAAADALCGAVIEQCSRGRVADWSEWLAQTDRSMATSGTTGLAAVVVAEITDDGIISGASIGDCGAWAFAGGEILDLTSGQTRKPLLGEGRALPVPFEGRIRPGTLLIATDGLWKYTSRDRIAKAAAVRPLDQAAAGLIDIVRLKSGALQDDVAVVICDVR